MGYLPQIQFMKFKPVSTDISRDLLQLERSFSTQNYKFGVLYCKKDQTENEMFSNGTTLLSGKSNRAFVSSPPHCQLAASDSNSGWKRFLNFLGERIPLKGWKNFTGGLDVKCKQCPSPTFFLWVSPC